MVSLTPYLPLPPDSAKPFRLLVFTEMAESSIAPYLTELHERERKNGIRCGSYPMLYKGASSSGPRHICGTGADSWRVAFNRGTRLSHRSGRSPDKGNRRGGESGIDTFPSIRLGPADLSSFRALQVAKKLEGKVVEAQKQ